ncbi:unnamed protein product [Adineta steineri]|uniref:RBR-type E3 ubiquitin transferase n=1 Tax=Adineta steineri TaxID=433720 RepID=A0A818T3J3_9BILA|nr:unnamed protein product [Adineta steineri]CAF1106450.1 unnamed protein product [Adineta steineri]CAF3616477.1 unnamed protein product [Adineta steineri]CAF3681266.1 unnamed protein product [Adineta steineri]
MRTYISPTSILANDEMTYYLMNEDDALKEMSKLIREANEIINLSSTTIVRLLLHHFNWDINTLTDRYWEDSDRLFRKLNIPNPNSSPSSIDYNPLSPPSNIEQNPLSPTSSNSKLVTCKTCYVDKPFNEFFSLPCHHQHCLTCWEFYLESAITSDSNIQKISCPSRCNQIMNDEQIYKLLSNNERVKKRYQHILINTFIETNRLTRWCPGNSCSTIVKIKTYLPNTAQMIACDECKTVFCFHCSKQWHEPVQCTLLTKWEKKNRDESMTSEWIVANTKDCPHCHASIEKNGGCNHMTCRKPGCVYEFCWLCLGPWKDHASRQCNVYEEGSSSKNQLSARENLARYMHYFTRYQTHNQSLELESKHSNQVEQRIHEMQAEAMSFTEQQAIYKAFDVLQQCRRTLKYTYAFAYYLYRNNQAEVFEQNQADLERATEALSGFLEQDIDSDKKNSLKLMDKTRYCDQRRKTLLDHCKEGYTEHYWAGLDTY